MAVDTVPAAVPDPTNHPPATPASGARQGTGGSLFAAIDPVRPAPDFDLAPTSAAAAQGIDETATGNGSSASYHGDETTPSSGNTGSRNSIQTQSVWRAWLLAGATRWGKGGGAVNKRLDLAKVKAQRRQVKENRQVSINRSGGLLGNRPGGSGSAGSAGGGGASGGGKSLNSKNSGGGAPKGPKNSNGSAHHGSSGRSGGSGGSGSHGGGGRGPGGSGGGSNGASAGRGGDGKAPKGPKSSKDRSGGGSGTEKSPKSGGGASPSGGGSSGSSGSGKGGKTGASGSTGGAGKGSSGGGAGSKGGGSKDADTGPGSGKVSLKKSGKGGSKDANTGSGKADGKQGEHDGKPGGKGGKGAATDGKSGGPGTPGTSGTTPADKNSKPGKGPNGNRTDQPKDSNGKPLNTKESREAGYRDGSLAARTAAHVKAYKDGVKDGWDDTTAAAEREKKQLDKAHQDRKKAREGEQDVTTPASSADYHQPEPIGVKGVTETDVILDGAAKGSITRGETRSLKDYEYKIRAKADSMAKIAEVTRALKKHAEEQASEVTKLAEGAKSVKGGDKLIGALTKLAEDAAAQVTKAEEINKQAVRAADGCTTVLSNVETRYGGLYKAVVDSNLATAAEIAFLKG